MTHAWCSDPSRDEAVRAAEDGRTAPLPTLGEVIASPFAEAAKRSVPVSKTGEPQSGMRTERITLEITREAWRKASLTSSDDWLNAAREAGIIFLPGESVRVVDTHAEAVAESVAWEGARDSYRGRILRLTEERDAAIREREKLRGEITSVLDRSEFASKELTRLRNRVAELESQLESVADRAAAAETALESRSSTSGEGLRDAQAAREINTRLGGIGRLPTNSRVAELEAAPAASVNSQTALEGSQAASGGGEGEPVAWGVVARQTNEVPPGCASPRRVSKEPVARFATVTEAQQFARKTKGTVVPIYAPPQPRGWLTEEERRTLSETADVLDDRKAPGYARFVRNLLARSSPPEVVLPELPFTPDSTHAMGWWEAIGKVKKALAAAGVAVKEVGK
jgi:hypothetical protein